MKKKGFTLIELLAVIVLLAIIMVIAVPKILKVIDSSRQSSWNSSVRLVKKAIETNSKIIDFETNEARTSPKILCNNETSNEIDVTSNLSRYAKIEDMDIKCKKNENYIFRLIGKNQFVGRQAIISCTFDGICNITNNGSSSEEESNIPDPVAFSTDSWATIAANTTSNKYHVGDEKTIQMDVNGDNTPETYHIMIVNMQPCTTETSETACGMVLQFKELLNITNDDDKKFNPSPGTNIGGWRDSKMRNYLNTTIYNKIPSDLRNKILNTTVVSGHERSASNNYVTQDKLYLLSAKEVGCSISYDSVDTETRKLDYYTDGASRRKYAYATSSSEIWWLRSVSSASYNDQVTYVGSGSSSCSSDNSNNGKSLAPAFRIGVN